MRLEDFDYDLPQERIAQHPLEDRSASKLLVYKEGVVHHQHFGQITDYLPSNARLVLNDTRVIPARFKVAKATGAMIEIMLLNPVLPGKLMIDAMESRDACTWECLIGNKKRWKSGPLEQQVEVNGNQFHLSFELIDREKNLVKLSWSPGDIPFAQMITAAGNVPLPPYLNRAPESSDRERYQTVYSHAEGAVAAPTAGLHFTEEIFRKADSKGISTSYLTLHVGAGTFLPVTESDVTRHDMHWEQLIIARHTIAELLSHDGPLVPVGTTSLRTLESLYWYGVQLESSPGSDFSISKELPLGGSQLSRKASLENVLNHLDNEGIDTLTGETGIYIYPGYQFRMVDALITNFHQPKSSLIMLVAALVGDQWKTIYQSALANDYRFLSYGDSSLLFASA